MWGERENIPSVDAGRGGARLLSISRLVFGLQMNGLVSLKEFPSVQNEGCRNVMSDGLVDEYQGRRGVPLLMIGAPATLSEHSLL